MPRLSSLIIDPAYKLTFFGEGANGWDLIVPTGSVIAQNAIFIGSQASGGATFVADETCTDGGNNTGWTFLDPAMKYTTASEGARNMKITVPVKLTDYRLFTSTVPETDFPVWDAATTYAVDACVIFPWLSVHKKYISVAAGNINHNPITDTDGTYWAELGTTNRWAALTSSLANGTTGSVVADILDDPCSDLTDWYDYDDGTGASSVSSGAFLFDAGDGGAGNATRELNIGTPPDKFTIELELEHDLLGTLAADNAFQLNYLASNWGFRVVFASDGLYIYSAYDTAAVEVGTNLVLTTGAAQKWRFEVDHTIDTDATVSIYLDDVFQARVACAWRWGLVLNDGALRFTQGGATTHTTSRINYVKVATGNGVIRSLSTMTYVFLPGSITSLSLLGLESTLVDVALTDLSDNLITNGESWTGATGTTQPTGWDKVGTPSDYTVVFNWVYGLTVTSDADGEGFSQTLTVEAATEYQILGLYADTDGSVAQYAIYDVSNSADIVTATDLPQTNGVEGALSCIFTTPAGCTSIKVSLLNKTSGDVVAWRSVRLAEVVYRDTTVTGSTVRVVSTDDIPATYPAAALTVTITHSTGVATVAKMIMGTVQEIGTTTYAPEIGILDYSGIKTDDYGVTKIVRRNYTKRTSCRVLIDNTNLDTINELLAEAKTTPMLIRASDLYYALNIYGIAKDFKIQASYPNNSILNLDIMGVIM